MSRKFLSLLLILAIVIMGTVSVIHAQDEMMYDCGEAEVTVTLAGGAVGAELEVNQAGAARFMEICPNITVEVLQLIDSTTDRLALYQQFWSAQSADVDLYQVDVIWAGIIAEHVVDMYEYMTEEQIAWYFPSMIEGQTIEGRLVAIPWFTDAAGLYYRTDLLEQYGVEVPTTWDELTVAAQTIQDGVRADTGNNDFWGYVWQGNSYEGLTCDAHEWLVSETGGTFISAEGEINVTEDSWLSALDRAAGWVGTISPEGVVGYQEEDAREVFQAGNAAFMRNWPYAWGAGNTEDSAIAGLFDYAPLPMGSSGAAAACLGGWQLAVSNYSDNVDAAATVAMYLTSPEEQYQRAISDFPVNPTIPALYEDPTLAETNPLYERMGPILATAVARPSGVTAARYADASSLFYQAVHSVLTGEADAASAMDDLELDLEDLLAELGM
jgi:trehalose/maltose transport system substrate-binding protein